jgi:FkbH-like protein
VKLTEALQILHKAQSLQGNSFSVLLASGFTPLYLETFFAAHLQQSISERRVKVKTGLYGNLLGTLEEELSDDTQAVAIAIEWSDLDARLGYRRLGGWGPTLETEIVDNVRTELARLHVAIERLRVSVPVAVSLPSLPLSPAFHVPGWQAGKAELQIWAALLDFSATLAGCGIAVASPQRLAEDSAPGFRFDLKAELLIGHPYSTSHAHALAESLARLLHPPIPKKGLITDLDDTLWRGLVGEIGPDAVAWDLSNNAQMYGLYQQTLAALSEQGVLIAAASKNNPDTVKQVFARQDIVLDPNKIFPIEVHWKPKSDSVASILSIWNIAPDAVVFIDDSPMEVSEVKAAWPEIDCLLFPKDDPNALLTLIRKLRDLFGKSHLNNEDALRLDSIRAAQSYPRENRTGAGQDVFLSQMHPSLTVELKGTANDARVLELINKTNQFNLNGIRRTEAELRGILASPDGFLAVVSYKDKYGPLGKIAVLAGRREKHALRIPIWVMSCRAFSRRIEYGCLDVLFSKFAVEELWFDFAVTAKNGPLRESLVPFLGFAPDLPFTVTRAQFEQHCPSLYFEVETIQ